MTAEADRMQALVYERMRGIAHGFMRGERRDHTLQATALANEVYLKVGSVADLPETHLGPIVATACRQILIDHARGRGRLKRSGGRVRLRLEDSDVATASMNPIDPLILDETLDRLCGLHERQARVFELKYFGAMSLKAVAALLDIGQRTAEADYAMAKAWLSRELSAEDADSEASSPAKGGSS